MNHLQAGEYFDRFTPHFDPRRFEFAIEYLKDHSSQDQRLIDIGCGDGATLALIKNNTRIAHLVGLDTSRNYLKKVATSVGCETIEGSILDPDIVERNALTFDHVVLGAVLHHIIGKTRKDSYHLALKCIINAWHILKPKGHLIIYEPAYDPSFIMSVVFWIKKLIGHFAEGRIELSKKWINIGLPVVSYYSQEQIRSIVRELPHAKMRVDRIVNNNRFGYVINRVGMGLIIEKNLM